MGMTEIQLNIHEAKTHLSRYLNEMGVDDRIVLCNRNRPVAEVRLLPGSKNPERRLGLAKGDFEIGNEFFEPLPDDLLDAFEGKA